MAVDGTGAFHDRADFRKMEMIEDGVLLCLRVTRVTRLRYQPRHRTAVRRAHPSLRDQKAGRAQGSRISLGFQKTGARFGIPPDPGRDDNGSDEPAASGQSYGDEVDIGESRA